MRKSGIFKVVCPVIITLMMAFILSGCTGSNSKSEIGIIKEGTLIDSSNSQYKEYKNTVKGFSMYAPKGWDIEENIKQTAFAFFNVEKDKDDFAENVNLLIQDMKDKPVTLQQYTDDSISEIKKMTSSNVESSEDITIGGLPGHKIVFTNKANNKDFKKMSVYTIKDGKVYLITYTATNKSYSKFLNIAEETIKSFKFI